MLGFVSYYFVHISVSYNPALCDIRQKKMDSLRNSTFWAPQCCFIQCKSMRMRIRKPGNSLFTTVFFQLAIVSADAVATEWVHRTSISYLILNTLFYNSLRDSFGTSASLITQSLSCFVTPGASPGKSSQFQIFWNSPWYKKNRVIIASIQAVVHHYSSLWLLGIHHGGN